MYKNVQNKITYCRMDVGNKKKNNYRARAYDFPIDVTKYAYVACRTACFPLRIRRRFSVLQIIIIASYLGNYTNDNNTHQTLFGQTIRTTCKPRRRVRRRAARAHTRREEFYRREKPPLVLFEQTPLSACCLAIAII